MPIEFRCGNCQALLRVSEKFAGRQTQCPKCDQVMVVPQAASPPTSPPPADDSNPFANGPGMPPGSPPPSGDPNNPYCAPADYSTGWSSAPQSMAATDIRPTLIQVGAVLRSTWTIFTQEWGMCLLGFLVFLVVTIVGHLVLVMPSNLARSNQAPQHLQVAWMIFGTLGKMVLTSWLSVGTLRYLLEIARGQPATLGTMFRGGPYLLRFIGTSLCVYLLGFGVIGISVASAVTIQALNHAVSMRAVLTGYLIGIGLYLIVWLFLWPSLFLVADARSGVFGSIRLACLLTRGNRLTVFLLSILMILVSLVAILLTCGVGILVVYPFLGLLATVLYLMMSGQPTADSRRYYTPPTPSFSGP